MVSDTRTPISEFGVSQRGLFREIGSGKVGVDSSGFASRFDDLPELRGDRAVKTYREMGRNDGLIGAVMFAVKSVLSGVIYHAEPADDTPEAEHGVQFLTECMGDMSHPWADMLEDSLDAVPYGWEFMETTYKQRLGPNPGEDLAPSRYDDGLIGWKKIEDRDQSGLIRWKLDDHGGIQGIFHQVDGQDEPVFIPIGKGILFRARRDKNSPEGYSMLRNAFRAARYKKNLEWIEGVAYERGSLGLPVIEMPTGADPSGSGTDYTRAQNLVKHVRNDSYAGVVLPPGLGPEPHQRWQFKLEGRQMNMGPLDVAIRRWGSEITTSLLAHFINLGMQSRGSYALSRDDRDLWHIALASLNRKWQETFNRFAVQRLFSLNSATFPNRDLWPTLVAGDIAQHDIDKVRQFLSDLIDRGAIRILPEDRNRIRSLIGWPDEPPGAEELTVPPPSQRPGNNGRGDEEMMNAIEMAMGMPIAKWSRDDWIRAGEFLHGEGDNDGT